MMASIQSLKDAMALSPDVKSLLGGLLTPGSPRPPGHEYWFFQFVMAPPVPRRNWKLRASSMPLTAMLLKASVVTLAMGATPGVVLKSCVEMTMM
jgi:hypothetical protein